MTIKVSGAKDIVAALEGLGDQRAMRAAVRKGLREAGKPMMEAARDGVPIDQGDLRRSIKMATAKRQRGDGDKFGIVIGIDQNEQPAREVTRKTNSGGGSTYRDPGVAGVGPIIEFGKPGTPAQPFMRRAFDALGEATIRRFANTIGPAIEQQAARLAKKRRRG